MTLALIYMGLLFVVATYGDRHAGSERWVRWRPTIYALSVAVYCTSWTFFGSVGLAARSGFDFLAIYLGPVLLFTLGYPFLKRIIQLAKSERITSIADFLAARYGKQQIVAIVATLILVIGTVPYIALQLKALSTSVAIIVNDDAVFDSVLFPFFSDLPLLIAIMMALFAILFGARHTDATEHQNGLMLAIAAESVVKLVAFLAIGIYITWFMFDGLSDILSQASEAQLMELSIFQTQGDGLWISYSILAFLAFILLPRQFHVMVVESNSPAESKRAVWLFPLYLILINLFVVPIALAGLITFGPSSNGDFYVLTLPIHEDTQLISLLAFIGGLSAATAMIIVATVALAIMVSNDMIVPWIVRRSSKRITPYSDMYGLILNIRRSAIFVIIMLGYLYYRIAGDSTALVSIGILAFAAVSQLAPAFFGGLFWRRATAKGAVAAMASGFFVWFYTLLIPTFVEAGALPVSLLTAGPFGIEALRPEALFGTEFSSLMHGTLWSLGVNTALFIAVSLMTEQSPVERLQADTFTARKLSPSPAYKRWHTPVKIAELKTTVAHYLGEERANRSFDRFARENSVLLEDHNVADVPLFRFAEQLLASAIGAASARLVVTLLINRKRAAPEEAVQLLDEATAAIQYNRGLLQVAIDEVDQGLAVFDADLRLTCWNRNLRSLLNLPIEFGEVGTSLGKILRYMAERGEFGLGSIESAISSRIASYSGAPATITERLAISQRAIEVRTKPMPDGNGFLLSFNDITMRLANEEALTRYNETLEARVQSRTEELTSLNQQLLQAKAQAEDANLGKTRFLSAAGHDILQPLNAARLYATSLADRAVAEGNDKTGEYAQKINASLEGVEDILGTVLDIGRLDTGAMKPKMTTFPLQSILDQLEVEFVPQAKDKGLAIKLVSTSCHTISDERLLRRLLQNLLSNAIKYTKDGKVVIGVRRHGEGLSVDVLDTGQGIPEKRQSEIFREFHRLEEGAKIASGLGLGLSIVERISRVLNHPIKITSAPGKGSRFSVMLPRVEGPAIASERKRDVTPIALTTGQLEGLTVLCVDNEPDILAGMEIMLSGWGCHVIIASTPEEALDVSRRYEEPIDGVIADYHLDVGTGIDLIEGLRERYGEAFPSILATADRSRMVQNMVEERNIHLLRKPIKPAALRALLMQWRSMNVAAE